MEQIFEIIRDSVNEIKELNGTEAVEVTTESKIVYDLGLRSLDIAQLIAILELKLEKDPFSEGATLAEVITIGDLCKLYA